MSKRNACVQCMYCDDLEKLGEPSCAHPAHIVRRFDRVSGEDRALQQCCFQIRREQDTDACPHWDAKPRSPSVAAEPDRAPPICEKHVPPVCKPNRKWWQFWKPAH